MAKSSYIDSFRFVVAGRISPLGDVIRLKVTDTQKEAKEFLLAHVERFPFSSPFITKPEKPVVGKEFYNKRKDCWHRGGKAMGASA